MIPVKLIFFFSEFNTVGHIVKFNGSRFVHNSIVCCCKSNGRIYIKYFKNRIVQTYLLGVLVKLKSTIRYKVLSKFCI